MKADAAPLTADAAWEKLRQSIDRNGGYGGMDAGNIVREHRPLIEAAIYAAHVKAMLDNPTELAEAPDGSLVAIRSGSPTDAAQEMRWALEVAKDIIDANPTEDTCRHDNDVYECAEPDGCADRSRREQIDGALAASGSPTDAALLENLRALSEAATPGPWGWRGYMEGSIELRTVGHGGLRVLTAMRGVPCLVETDGGDIALTSGACGSCRREFAKPHDGFVDRETPCEHRENLNTLWFTKPGEGYVVPANDFAVREVPYRGDVADLEHPDAALIVEAVNYVRSRVASGSPADAGGLVTTPMTRNERLRAAMSEVLGLAECHCDVAWTGRGRHQSLQGCLWDDLGGDAPDSVMSVFRAALADALADGGPG